MAFSVLMSVYGKENALFFKEALKSILMDQTIQPDEFVLICDGPLTPELEYVIDEYVDNFKDIFHVYRLSQNMGLGKALNYGLSKCTYELIARADSDDICVPDRFEKQLDIFSKNDSLVLLGGAIDEFIDMPNEPEHFKIMPSKMDEIVKMNIYRNPINHMTVMLKKSVILKVGSYIDLPYVEDYYLWNRLIANGYQIENLPDVLVHARIGNGMIKRRGNKKYLKSWKELNQYKRKSQLITQFQYAVNIALIGIFVYSPEKLKKIAYKFLLRS